MSGMATKKTVRPTLTLFFEGRGKELRGRGPSYALRKEIRALSKHTEKQIVRVAKEMPDALAEGSEEDRLAYLRTQNEDEIDRMLDEIGDAENIGDRTTVLICRAAIDLSSISDGDPIREHIEAEPFDEDGELTEFWAVQDWEEIAGFAGKFRRDT